MKLCEGAGKVPVFGQAWYLDIVCNKEWSVAMSIDKLGSVSGAWPFMWRKKKGFAFIQMPAYTPFLGPYVFYPEHINSAYKRNSFYFKTLQELESQFPKASYTRLKMSPQNKVWYPVFSKAYSQTTRYTYMIYYKSGIEKIALNLKPQLRNVVSKVANEKHITISKDVHSFLDLLKETFNKNEISKFFDRQLIGQIIHSAIERKQGCLYSYKDMDAGIFVLNDENCSYLLFTSTKKVGKSEEGIGKLIWRAICDAVEQERDFDFEGSMIPGVEKFFRSFGGDQVPYHQITKVTNPILKLYNILRS